MPHQQSPQRGHDQDSSRGITLGRVLGITVVLDWSLLVIAALITTTMALGVLAQWHPDWPPGLRWLIGLLAAVLLFSSILIHEFSHALMARHYGTRVERITLFIFGGMAHMEDEPEHWRAEFMIAIVGPLTSLVLGSLLMVAAGLFIDPVELESSAPQAIFSNLGPAATLLFWGGNVNIILALFNLVPAFPLDGGRVLRAVMWGISGRYIDATRWASSGGRFFGWLLIMAGIFMVFGIQVPFFGVGSGGFWLMFMGWFLNRVATVSFQQAGVRESLKKVRVADIMRTEFDAVNPELSITTLVEDHILARGQRGFPVVENGSLVGMISFEDVRRISQDRWPATRVADLMTSRENLLTLEADDDSFDALSRLSAGNVNQMPVLQQGKLVGLLRREDVLRWMQLYRSDLANASSSLD